MNQDFVKLNKSIILGAIVAGILAAIVAYIFSDQEDYILTTYTVIAEYVGFFGIFFLLFYLDNKDKYTLDSGKKDKAGIKKAIIKLVSSLGISEVFYLLTRWFSGYYLLTIDFQSNVATVISEIMAFTVFIIAMNFGVKFTKLYKHER